MSYHKLKDGGLVLSGQAENNMKIPQITFQDSAQIVVKNWGKEIVIDNNDEYCGKLLVYEKPIKSSAHMHYDKSESMMVLKGSFNFYYWDDKGNKQTKYLGPNATIRIPKGRMHQLEALTADSTIVECSTPHSDEDVYRTEASQS